MRLFSSLGRTDFALLFSGQTISRVGDHLYQVALAWWVLQKTGSAVQMGVVLIFTFAPMLLFLLIGGVAVDRYHRARVMLWSDIGRGAVVAVIAVLAYMGMLEVWHLYVGGVVFGVADAFFQPAFAAAVPEMVPRDDLNSANSITSLSVQIGRIAGPALGAGIIGIGGIPLAFAINSASFFASALCLVPLAIKPAAARLAGEGAGTSVWADVRAGFGHVMALPWLWITIGVLAIINVTLAGPYSVSLPFLVKENLGRDVGTLGMIYAIFPIGYAVAAVWLGSLRRIRHRGWIIYLGLGVAGAMIGLIGLPIGMVGICVAAFINGACLEAAALCWMNALQEKIPPEMLGRVESIDALGSYALMPIGYAVAGAATDWWGAPAVFVVAGVTTTLVAIVLLLHPAVRRLD